MHAPALDVAMDANVPPVLLPNVARPDDVRQKEYPFKPAELNVNTHGAGSCVGTAVPTLVQIQLPSETGAPKV